MPSRPIDRLRQDAKALRKAFAAGNAEASAGVTAALGRREVLKHADALHVIAREEGHASWPRLKLARDVAAIDRDARVHRLDDRVEIDRTIRSEDRVGEQIQELGAVGHRDHLVPTQREELCQGDPDLVVILGERVGIQRVLVGAEAPASVGGVRFSSDAAVRLLDFVQAIERLDAAEADIGSEETTDFLKRSPSHPASASTATRRR